MWFSCSRSTASSSWVEVQARLSCNPSAVKEYVGSGSKLSVGLQKNLILHAQWNKINAQDEWIQEWSSSGEKPRLPGLDRGVSATAMIPLFGLKPMDWGTTLIMPQDHWEPWWPPSRCLRFLKCVLCVGYCIGNFEKVAGERSISQLVRKSLAAGWGTQKGKHLLLPPSSYMSKM